VVKNLHQKYIKKINNMFSKKNLKSEILYISKVTKILEKGKVIRFKVIVVTGNLKNLIGLGIGKDISLAIARKKAIESSYKNLIFVNHFFGNNEEKTIPNDFLVKIKKTLILFKPNAKKTGVRASKLFFVLAKLAGFNQLLVKRIKSKNVVNNIYSFFEFINRLNQLKR
jgi:small subunit ribosomal protein S5